MDRPDTFRLFTAGDPAGVAAFHAGRVPDGRGLLAGPCTDGLLLVWFDPAGRLLGPAVVPLPSSQAAEAVGLAPDFRGWTADALRWLTAAGFRSVPIEVAGFSTVEPVPAAEAGRRGGTEVGVYRYPKWADPVLPGEDPDLTDPHLEKLARRLRRWDESGSFVVYWGGGTYHLDKNGGYSS